MTPTLIRGTTPTIKFCFKKVPVENIINAVNSQNGKIIEGINWAEEVKKSLLKSIGYDIFKN